MKISTLIRKLEAVQTTHGDLTVYTYDGRVMNVKAYPCTDGVDTTASDDPSEPNEIVLEFQTV